MVRVGERKSLPWSTAVSSKRVSVQDRYASAPERRLVFRGQAANGPPREVRRKSEYTRRPRARSRSNGPRTDRRGCAGTSPNQGEVAGHLAGRDQVPVRRGVDGHAEKDVLAAGGLKSLSFVSSGRHSDTLVTPNRANIVGKHHQEHFSRAQPLKGASQQGLHESRAVPAAPMGWVYQEVADPHLVRAIRHVVEFPVRDRLEQSLWPEHEPAVARLAPCDHLLRRQRRGGAGR